MDEQRRDAAQCEAHCSWIDKVAAVEGQPDVDMVSGLSGHIRGLAWPLPPVRCGVLCPLSRFHDDQVPGC